MSSLVRQESVCRFCLDPKLDDINPLISPCKCVGSVQYVHIVCIKKWRQITEVPEFIVKCQLCLTNYTMPLRYPLEEIPDIRYETAWFFLSRPSAFIFITHYLSFISVVYMLEDTLMSTPHGYLMPYVPITRMANVYFYAISTVLFTTYLSFYLPYIRRIKNWRLYLELLTQPRVGTVFPSLYMSSMLISYLLINICICPFGYIFMILLPRFMDVHKEILYKINSGAEL